MELRQRRAGRHVLVELLVVQLTAGKCLLTQQFRQLEPRAEVVHRIHGARVVDVVGGDEGGVQRTRPRGVEELVGEARFVHIPDEDAVHPEVLRAGVGVEVLPLGMLRVLGRIARIRADVAEAARHADAIGSHQLLVVVVARVGVEARRVPLRRRLLVEIRIREQPQADDAGCVTVVGADRHGLAARADFHAGVLGLVLERVGRATRAAHVQPQAEAIGARAAALVETRLVHQPEILPAIVAAIVQARVIRHDLEQVEQADALGGQGVPHAVVAAGPHDPVVAPLDRRRGGVGRRDAGQVGLERGGHGLRITGNAVIHVGEVVFICGRKTLRAAADTQGFIPHIARTAATGLAGG